MTLEISEGGDRELATAFQSALADESGSRNKRWYLEGAGGTLPRFGACSQAALLPALPGGASLGGLHHLGIGRSSW